MSFTDLDRDLLAQAPPPIRSVEVSSDVYLGGAGCIDIRESSAIGAGMPVVLALHGIGSSSAGYRAVFAGLGREARVIAWNAPGYGGSTPLTSESPAVTSYVQALDGLRQALNISRLSTLVGSSWGSVIALAYAATYPDRVDHLVLSAPNTARGHLTAADRAVELQKILPAANSLQAGDRGAVVDRLVAASALEAVREKVARLRDDATAHGWSQAMRMLYQVSTPALIGKVVCPTTIVVGIEDTVAPMEQHAMVLHRQAANSKVVTLPGIGHMPKLEAPSQFNDILRAALRPPSNSS